MPPIILFRFPGGNRIQVLRVNAEFTNETTDTSDTTSHSLLVKRHHSLLESQQANFHWNCSITKHDPPGIMTMYTKEYSKYPTKLHARITYSHLRTTGTI